MKVILLQDVRKVGKKDEVIEVSDGYARNFLIKKGLAVAYTKGSSKVLKEQLDEKAHQREIEKQEAKVIAEKLKSIKLIFYLKAGKQGSVFGSVSSKQIIEALHKQNIMINKRMLKLEQPISSLGITRVPADLFHGEVMGKVVVQVLAKE